MTQNGYHITISQMMFALVFLFIQTNLVYGETYKCRGSNGRIEYRDHPCSANSATESVSKPVFTTTGVPVQPNQSEVAVQTNSSNANMRDLDVMVDEAIGTGNLRRAKELALTSEHWAKIRAAQTPKQKSDAEIKVEQASSEECKQAKRAYDLEAGAIKPNSAQIDAKESLMHIACGAREPIVTIRVR